MTVICLKYRIYPSKSQITEITGMLKTCRQIYNSMLLWRKVAWETEQISVNRYEQKMALPVWKGETDETGNLLHPELSVVNAQVLQQVVDRVDLADKAFFRRVQSDEKPGFPRFKGRGRYNSLTYVQDTAFSIGDDYIRFSKIGQIKAVLHRKVEGKLKQCVLSRQGLGWYACITIEAEPLLLPENNDAVALDLGLEKFAVLSNGEVIENPRFFRHHEKRLAKAQRKLAKDKRNRARQRTVSRIHTKVRHQRHDFVHKLANSLIALYGIFFLEDLNPKNMSKRPTPKKDEETGEFLPNGAAQKSGLNKSILDAAWTMFRTILKQKAERAVNRRVVEINPAYTSQDCHKCGYRPGKEAKKKLSDRWHYCPKCSASLDRDLNAAMNIFALGTQRIGESP